ncbi:MAG: hypothetical protein A2020_14075 [Lentisphaerae bacterium GWF2_45_14]|nr:MAG: hypothetical protein A2020_14075 [Lentisphaerae bacterium GWF2_45_14]
MIKVKQLNVRGLDYNFSYLVFDEVSRDAAIIDPCGDVSVIRKALEDAKPLSPKYILITHGHHDHVSGLKDVLSFFDAAVAAHPECAAGHSINLADRQQLSFGGIFIEVLYAPGHSPDGVLYRMSDDSALFTGDTLFIDCCGYCLPRAMFNTMRNVIFPLAGSNIVYSGHDYGAVPFRNLGEEKRLNPYLATDDFDKFREELKKL